jgi:predicted AlkP superfamily phosphohydrolase/phosphomutase
MSESNGKVLILGLDGATWRIMRPLLDKGELPNLAALIASGAKGVLQSSIPPLSAPAWANFQTGANAGKHNIYDFRIFDRATRQVWMVSARDFKLPTLWQVVSAADRRVIAINVPVTYPPQPVNGIVVGGLLAQEEDQSLVYPPERFDEILGRHPHYQISPPMISQRQQMGRRAFVLANIDVERRRCDLALDLMASEPWDLFMVQNQCVDYIQHAYYPVMDPGVPEFDPQAHEDVCQFYRAVDENIGRLVAAAPSGTDIVVLSDHGFKLQRRMIHLAPWLRKEGYLVESISPQQRLLQLVRQVDVFKLRRHFAHWILRDKKTRFGAAASATASRLDWTRSRAFAVIGSVFGCVYINHDIVKDAEALLAELQDRLLNLTDPKTDRRVVAKALLGRDIYHGPFAQNGPDLVLEPAEDYTFGAPSLIAHQHPFSDIDFNVEIPGGHHPEGIVVWAGPGVKEKQGIEADLMDIAPTVLTRMGLSVPDYMDGQVLADIFTPRPEVSFQPWDLQTFADRDAHLPKDESALRKRLTDLGYL